MFDFKRALEALSPEQKQRMEARRAEQAAIDAVTLQIRAVRTDCFTGLTRIVMVGVYPKGDYLQVVGGPTGYESMPIENLDRAIAADGWLACFGTEQRYDKMFVPAAELKSVREHLRKLGTKWT